MKRECKQERLSLKEGSSFQPLRQGRILTAQLWQCRERNIDMHLHPLKIIKNWKGELNHRVKYRMIIPESEQGVIGERIYKRAVLASDR